jgi:hypothetical protein
MMVSTELLIGISLLDVLLFMVAYTTYLHVLELQKESEK